MLSVSISRSSSAGGWPQVNSSVRLEMGVSDPSVQALRQRLIISGDLPQSAGISNSFDSYVDGAVKRFQARHGLPADGVLGEYSIKAMNIAADVRLGQLNTNIVRLQSMSGDLGERYVLVNIPAAYIEAVENGRVATRHTAVVGRISRQTHIINSKIYEVIINPYWTSPRSIVEKDIVPLMRKDPEYLKKNSIRLIDGKGNEVAPETIDWNAEKAPNLTFRQDPGKTNAMASTKINFHNPNNEYMHDTPQQGLFNKLARFRIVWLRARSERARPDDVAAARYTRLVTPADRDDNPLGPEFPDQAGSRSPGLFQVYHCLGGDRRYRPVPRRHLRDGRRAGAGAADHDRHRAGRRFRRARQPAAISRFAFIEPRPRPFKGAAFCIPGRWRISGAADGGNGANRTAHIALAMRGR